MLGIALATQTDVFGARAAVMTEGHPTQGYRKHQAGRKAICPTKRQVQ